MDLRHLEVLVTVSDERTISAAARRLHVSQPALSQLVKRIETELGLELFDRSSSPLALTAAGREFLPQARGLLAMYADAVAVARSAGRRRVVAIGATPMIAASLFAELLVERGTVTPHTEIQLVEASSGELLALMSRGIVDVAVMAESAVPEGTPFEPVLRSEILAAVGSTSPAVLASSIEVEQLFGFPLLLPKAGGVRHHLDPFLRSWPAAPHIAFESGSTGTILGLVQAGLGLALVPALLVTGAVRERFPRIRFLSIQAGPTPLAMGIATRTAAGGTGTAVLGTRLTRSALVRCLSEYAVDTR
ncbi:LysR family transcriptional regulator [Sphaerisporangium perillae]|uniref:LysR family transcriptional regulator n=1 Tax=Sphaerisporangium perillae TaxID=2935860 RepID=UPI00200D0832|nr:LysR family transcriptional regulator [Sphaerisporangium perillae]